MPIELCSWLMLEGFFYAPSRQNGRLVRSAPQNRTKMVYQKISWNPDPRAPAARTAVSAHRDGSEALLVVACSTALNLQSHIQSRVVLENLRDLR